MYKIRDSLAELNIKKERSDTLFLLWIAIILAVMMAVLAISQSFFTNVSVSGSSMEPTLHTGDLVVINTTKKAQVGDVIVIKGVKSYWLIKRVIACEKGDIVEIKNSKVYVNGELLQEDYVLNGVQASGDDNLKIQLKENEIFYLGDNRINSSDSRLYGACDEQSVVGVVAEWSMKYKTIRGKIAKFLPNLKVKIQQKLK